MSYKNVILCLRKLQNTLGHTAYNEILPVEQHCRIVQGGRHRSIGFKALFNLCYKSFFTHSHHKLLHIHRIHGFHIDLTYRKREFFPACRNAEQAAESYDMILRRILAKIFQRS